MASGKNNAAFPHFQRMMRDNNARRAFTDTIKALADGSQPPIATADNDPFTDAYVQYMDAVTIVTMSRETMVGFARITKSVPTTKAGFQKLLEVAYALATLRDRTEAYYTVYVYRGETPQA